MVELPASLYVKNAPDLFFRASLQNCFPIWFGKCLELEVKVNRTNVQFDFDSYRLVCRMIEGRYPNYRAVIPQNQSKRVVLKRNDLLAALKRVSVFCNISSSLVVLIR